jgi:chromate transporter
MTTPHGDVDSPVPLRTIFREWGRIGCTGFGGPPAHIALLRRLCVDREAWLSPEEFEDGIAAVNLLPGPASTQLAIYCAWRLRGPLGAVAGGLCFIAPGLILILGLAVLFLQSELPTWLAGAGAGAGAVVPAVALHAASGLTPASWRRIGSAFGRRLRWTLYLVAGAIAAATIGPWLVLVLVACGLIELASTWTPSQRSMAPMVVASTLPTLGVLGSLSWVALKVGALSYGGGFVIIPLMQHDAVVNHHWMTNAQFLNAVALGQITPGPVVQTVAAVGYAAAGIGGGLLAAAIAFAPSFVFVIGGGQYFDRLRRNGAAQSFLTGAGPAAIGAIAGAAISLGLALGDRWQLVVLAIGVAWLFGARRGVVSVILIGAVLGAILVELGASAPS